MYGAIVWSFVLVSVGSSLDMSGGRQIPTGHLQPLGSHRPADVPIDELHEPPDPVLFWERYVNPGKPVIVRGAIKSSPAYRLWDMDYLKEKYGGLELRLQEKGEVYPIGAKGLGRDTISNFADTYSEKNSAKYVASQLPVPMYKDVHTLSSMQCGSFRDSLVEIDVWMSGGRRNGVLHKDPFNNWNCMVRGTKVWALIDDKYHDLLHPYWRPERMIAGISQIDPRSVDLIKFPNITKVRWSNVTTYPGDCLFIPRSYYHQINSYGDPNIATGVLFSRLVEFNHTDCDETKKLENTPLSETMVTWNWQGRGDLTMGNEDHRFVRNGLLKGAEINGNVTAEHIIEEFKLLFPELPARDIEIETKKAFTILDKEKKGFLTKDDVTRLDIHSLRQFIVALTPVDPSNTERLEYDYVDPNDIRHIVERLIAKHTKFTEEMLVEEYCKLECGTEDKAKEIFRKLGEGRDVVTSSDVDSNLKYAIANWLDALQGIYSQGVLRADRDAEFTAKREERLLILRDDIHYRSKREREELLDSLKEENWKTMGVGKQLHTDEL